VTGKRLGQLNAVTNFAKILGGLLVIFGFRYLNFDFEYTFVISAFESTSEKVLLALDKGHSVTDLDDALNVLEQAKLPVQPTWVPFNPWASLDDYLDFLNWIRERKLIASIPPVQYSIRLLLPPKSKLLHEYRSSKWLGPLDPANFTYAWQHPDLRMDTLHKQVSVIVEQKRDDPWGAFQAIEQAGKTGQIYVTAYDNLWAARESIMQGRLHATIEQHPELMGFEGVVIAYKSIQNEVIPTEKLVRLDLITKANIQ